MHSHVDRVRSASRMPPKLRIVQPWLRSQGVGACCRRVGGTSMGDVRIGETRSAGIWQNHAASVGHPRFACAPMNTHMHVHLHVCAQVRMHILVCGSECMKCMCAHGICAVFVCMVCAVRVTWPKRCVTARSCRACSTPVVAIVLGACPNVDVVIRLCRLRLWCLSSCSSRLPFCSCAWLFGHCVLARAALFHWVAPLLLLLMSRNLYQRRIVAHICFVAWRMRGTPHIPLFWMGRLAKGASDVQGMAPPLGGRCILSGGRCVFTLSW